MLGFLSISLATIVAYVLKFHYEYVRAIYLSMRIAGPRALPLLGNGLLFINKSSAENFEQIFRLINDYGSFIRVWLGPELNVIVTDPNDVEILLSSPKYIAKSSEYKFVSPWLNEGLLLSKGKKWHERRKIITPAFHFKILEQFVEVFDRLGTTVVTKTLQKYDRDDEFEMYPVAVLYALDVMCETAMGVSVDALSKPNSDYVKAVKEIAYVLFTRILDFILRFEFFYKFSKLYRRQNAALKILHGFTDNVIQRRRQELLAISINNNKTAEEQTKENDDIGIKKKSAFLDVLLKSTVNGKPLNDLEIREEVDTFMFEGHDTTTSGITFCLYNIAKNPEVQEKCMKEIREVFGDDKTTPTTLSNLNDLHYLELVIKESLRLYPSVPFIGRKALEDIELTQNRIIPAGANINVSIYNMNHNPELFDEPEKFRPERFGVGNSTNKANNPFAYIPFSAGPRNCIGQKFATLEIKSIVSKILRHYHIKLAKDSLREPILSAELILRPETAINFSIEPRVY